MAPREFHLLSLKHDCTKAVVPKIAMLSILLSFHKDINKSLIPKMLTTCRNSTSAGFLGKLMPKKVLPSDFVSSILIHIFLIQALLDLFPPSKVA